MSRLFLIIPVLLFLAWVFVFLVWIGLRDYFRQR